MEAEEFIKAHRAEYNTCDAIYSSYHYDAMERYANQRVIEELESLKKGLIPKIRIKYEIGHYQSKDTQRFIEGVRSSVLEINNRIKELKTK